ncbi:MAG: anti-sigma F factor, partial [Firmicutes bacterium]|nr:anti-sigma F factor [Bacillota bacterium]
METVTNRVLMQFPSNAANIGFARTAIAVFASQLDFTLDEL